MLFGQGLDEAEVRDLVTLAGPLFAEAAFAAAQQGDGEAALNLAREGRARLMAVSWRLGQDERPGVAALRAAVRAAERTVGSAQGENRAAAVQNLLSLRQKLLGLVDDTGTAGHGPGSALAEARAIVAHGGAVVVPIITSVGGELLVVANRDRPSTTGQPEGVGSSPSTDPSPSISAVDLPDVDDSRLFIMAFGWLGHYKINDLPEEEFEQRWPEWVTAITDLGPSLWYLVGLPLDTALKAAGVQHGARIVWLPTGALGILPLGLALNPASGRYLADDYEIVYAPSLDALASAQQRIATPAPATLALVTNPTGDLSGTEKEGRLVASYFPVKARTLLTRRTATPDAVLSALKGRTHWHFASHGTFSWADARQSGLIMYGNERLSVGRLFDAYGLGHLRLVVLSACETGLYRVGDPDEFIGLPGAFTALGAAGVVATLWPVSDVTTALLISKFYELYMGEGLAPPTALSRAQLWLRQATNVDLQAYARAATRQGRLDSRHLSDIEAELSEVGLKRSRHAAQIQWVAPEGKRAAGKRAPAAAQGLARPYVHPYYWAGFIYTGL